MKKHVFLYLFVFAILYILFQFVSSKKAYDTTNRTIEDLQIVNERTKKENRVLKDSINQLLSDVEKFGAFSFDYDLDAKGYYYAKGYDDSIAEYVVTKLMETNSLSEGDNKLIPYVGVDGPMKIYSARVVNHRWILCTYSDGTKRGQLMIAYFINKDKSVDFETEAYLLYP